IRKGRWVVFEDEDTQLIRKKTRGLSFADAFTASLPGLRIHVTLMSQPLPRKRGNPLQALVRLANREWEAALAEADQAVEDEPDASLPLVARSLAHLALGHLEASQDDAIDAHRLAQGDRDLDALLIAILDTRRTVIRESRLLA